MRRFVFAGLLLAATFPIVLAQDADVAPREKADVQTETPSVSEPANLAIYQPMHLPASEMALLVQETMGESVHVTVEPTRNQLLIRASKAQHEQIQAVLKALDQPAKTITFEVTFADIPAQAAGGEPNKEQASSEEAWLARLKNLEDGAKGNISRLRLTAIENQKAMVQFGGQTPIVTGVNRGFGGRGGERSAVVQQTQTGTIVQCTARVLENNTIIAELEIERSRLAPESGAVLDESDDRAALRTPGHLTTTCKTTVKLKPGKPHLLSGQKSQTGAGSTLNLIVITAELPRE